MTHAGVGIGSQYAFTAEGANRAALDGGKDYSLTLPAGIPVLTFWAIDIHATDVIFPTVDDAYTATMNKLGQR